MEYQRPWVQKFETGEYLRKWRGYSPNILGCTTYSVNIGIGEEKFFKCVGEFNGIGDVEWWIKRELDSLSPDDLKELELICSYKKYLEKTISHEIIQEISYFYGCEPFHIWRTGLKNIISLCKEMGNFYEKILNGSKNCMDERTIKLREKKNRFKIYSLDEYSKLEVVMPPIETKVKIDSNDIIDIHNKIQDIIKK